MGASLSTTSYAVLGLLALRSWTPYELTQQYRRSLAHCWPSSERSLYSEPERLVAAGLASVSVEESEARPRRRYAATDAGRAALRAWLSTRPAPPRQEVETLLRVLFADQAGPDELVQALVAMREDLTARHEQGRALVAQYRDGSGPFPERAHLVVLFADLQDRLHRAMEDWVDDALLRVGEWDATSGHGLDPQLEAVVERLLARGPATP